MRFLKRQSRPGYTYTQTHRQWTDCYTRTTNDGRTRPAATLDGGQETQSRRPTRRKAMRRTSGDSGLVDVPPSRRSVAYGLTPLPRGAVCVLYGRRRLGGRTAATEADNNYRLDDRYRRHGHRHHHEHTFSHVPQVK